MQNKKQYTLVALLTFYFGVCYSKTADNLSTFQNPLVGSMAAYFNPQASSYILAMDKVILSPISGNNVTQSTIWHKGKVLRSKGTCKWLIRITEANEASLIGKLILPTGDFPEVYQKKRTILRFEMTPLRQSIPAGCKADLVASISNLTKD
jgi:hypothetical protein